MQHPNTNTATESAATRELSLPPIVSHPIPSYPTLPYPTLSFPILSFSMKANRNGTGTKTGATLRRTKIQQKLSSQSPRVDLAPGLKSERKKHMRLYPHPHVGRYVVAMDTPPGSACTKVYACKAESTRLRLGLTLFRASRLALKLISPVTMSRLPCQSQQEMPRRKERREGNRRVARTQRLAARASIFSHKTFA